MSFIYQPSDLYTYEFSEATQKHVMMMQRKLVEATQKFQLANKTPCLYLNTEPNGLDEFYVMQAFDELLCDYKYGGEYLNVILHSNGGDIEQGYKLSKLLRKFAKKELNFYVPYAAKSSATLMVLGGNNVYMSPIAELGPLDTQFLYHNRLSESKESYSFRSILPTIKLLRDEFEHGSMELANAMLDKMNNPYWLAEQMESEKLMERYAIQLLNEGMLAGADKVVREEKASTITKNLIHGYPSHSYCITIEEAKAIGLSVKPLSGTKLTSALAIVQLDLKINYLFAEAKRLMQR